MSSKYFFLRSSSEDTLILGHLLRDGIIGHLIFGVPEFRFLEIKPPATSQLGGKARRGKPREAFLTTTVLHLNLFDTIQALSLHFLDLPAGRQHKIIFYNIPE